MFNATFIQDARAGLVTFVTMPARASLVVALALLISPTSEAIEDERNLRPFECFGLFDAMLQSNTRPAFSMAQVRDNYRTDEFLSDQATSYFEKLFKRGKPGQVIVLSAQSSNAEEALYLAQTVIPEFWANEMRRDRMDGEVMHNTDRKQESKRNFLRRTAIALGAAAGLTVIAPSFIRLFLNEQIGSYCSAGTCTATTALTVVYVLAALRKHLRLEKDADKSFSPRENLAALEERYRNYGLRLVATDIKNEFAKAQPFESILVNGQEEDIHSVVLIYGRKRDITRTPFLLFGIDLSHIPTQG